MRKPRCLRPDDKSSYCTLGWPSGTGDRWPRAANPPSTRRGEVPVTEWKPARVCRYHATRHTPRLVAGPLSPPLPDQLAPGARTRSHHTGATALEAWPTADPGGAARHSQTATRRFPFRWRLFFPTLDCFRFCDKLGALGHSRLSHVAAVQGSEVAVVRTQAWQKEGAAVRGVVPRPALTSIHQKRGEWPATLPATAAPVTHGRPVTHGACPRPHERPQLRAPPARGASDQGGRQQGQRRGRSRACPCACARSAWPLRRPRPLRPPPTASPLSWLRGSTASGAEPRPSGRRWSACARPRSRPARVTPGPPPPSASAPKSRLGSPGTARRAPPGAVTCSEPQGPFRVLAERPVIPSEGV